MVTAALKTSMLLLVQLCQIMKYTSWMHFYNLSQSELLESFILVVLGK